MECSHIEYCSTVMTTLYNDCLIIGPSLLSSYLSPGVWKLLHYKHYKRWSHFDGDVDHVLWHALVTLHVFSKTLILIIPVTTYFYCLFWLGIKLIPVAFYCMLCIIGLVTELDRSYIAQNIDCFYKNGINSKQRIYWLLCFL